jgi:archaeosine-15-forming tRNA-guanine transglycosylase
MMETEELHRLEHQERMYRAMLNENLRKQRELQIQEGKLKTQLTHTENQKYCLMKANIGLLTLVLIGACLTACHSTTPFTRLASLVPCDSDNCGKLPK